MQIALPRTWTQQPQFFTGIDWSNPITRGLVLAASPIGRVMYDHVSRAAWTAVSAPTYEATVGGVALKTVSGSSQYGYFNSPVAIGPLTLFHEHIVDSTSNGAHVSLGTPSGTERFVIFYNTDNYFISAVGNQPGSGSPDTTILAGTGVLTRVCGRVGAATTFASGIPDIFLNGVKGTPGNNSWAPTGALTRLYIGARMNSTAGVFASQRATLTLLFNRALSDAEIRAISANPWQVFRPIV